MRKKVIAVTIAIIIAFSCVGCGGEKSKSELQKEVSTMAMMMQEDEQKIKSLESALQALGGKDIGNEIKMVKSGSGDISFVEVKDVIVFENPLTYTGAVDAASDGYINVTKNVAIMPSSNWLVRLLGSGVELNHPSGISGTLRVGRIMSIIQQKELINAVLGPFISSLSPESVSYGDLFIGDTCWGKNAIVKVGKDKESKVVIVGALGHANTSIVYAFAYEGEEDKIKNEVVEVLLGTVRVNGASVTVGG